MSTRHFDDLSSEHPCLFAGEEEYGVGNIFGLDELPHGYEWDDSLLQPSSIHPVCVGPGATQLTVMPYGATSRAMLRVSASSVALLAP